jgi:hypothetical protein
LSNLGQQLEEARAEVARLERLALVASCAELGHPMKFVGCRNCGCDRADCWGCSIPVHSCACGDSDYGDNAEARKIIADCAAERAAVT